MASGLFLFCVYCFFIESGQVYLGSIERVRGSVTRIVTPFPECKFVAMTPPPWCSEIIFTTKRPMPKCKRLSGLDSLMDTIESKTLSNKSTGISGPWFETKIVIFELSVVNPTEIVLLGSEKSTALSISLSNNCSM